MTAISKRILGFLLIFAAGAACLAFFVFRRKELAGLAIAAIEGAHRAKIVEQQSRIDALSGDLATNGKRIKAAEADLEKRKDDLVSTYKIVGLTAEQTAERLKRLKL